MAELMERLEKEVAIRKASNTFRKLPKQSFTHDLLSNDYLGLSHKKNETDFFITAGGSSRLIAGTSEYHLLLEEELAQKFDAEKALIFNSGYTANLGVLSCIASKNDLIIYDEFVHASIKDGMRLSLAKRIKFKHNCIEDLERILKANQNSYSTVFIVVEGLYSMDGDFCPIKEVTKLKQQYDFQLIVDEAHSIGCIGDDGKGLVVAENCLKDTFLRVITFGKAFGSHGAAILCNAITQDYLINFSRPFIYTTALPPSVIQDIRYKINFSGINNEQNKLQENISYFRKLFKSFHLKSASNSPIQTLFFPISQLKAIEEKATHSGIGIKAILPPTVPLNQERLRISIHANTKKETLDQLYECIMNEVV